MSWDVSKDIVLFVQYLMVMLNIVQWCRLLGSQSSREWWLRTSLETAWWCLLTQLIEEGISADNAQQCLALWINPEIGTLKSVWRTTWPFFALWEVILDPGKDTWPSQGPIFLFYPLLFSPTTIAHFNFGWLDLNICLLPYICEPWNNGTFGPPTIMSIISNIGKCETNNMF